MSQLDSSKPQKGQRTWLPENEQLVEGVFYIRDPDDLTIRHSYPSLDAAIREKYKGFNYPYCKDDTFVLTVTRVSAWFQKHYESLKRNVSNQSQNQSPSVQQAPNKTQRP